MLKGIVNRLFRHVQSGDYLFVFDVQGDRVLGIVTSDDMKPRPGRLNRVFVYLGEFAKQWREVPTPEDVLRDLLDSTVEIREIVIDLRRGRCPVHGENCGKDKPAEKLN